MVRVSKRAAECNSIAYELLDLFDLGKAPVLLARPDDLAVEARFARTLERGRFSLKRGP